MKKRIFITGASSGIGRATAELLVRQGHEAWGTSRNPARLPVLAGLHHVTLDLADPESLRSSFGRASAEAGGFDVLINNAGRGHFDPAETLPAATLHEQFQILVFAQIELCQLALKAMQESGAGLIINVTSMAARLPVPYMAAYNAAKAAMASFIMTLQLELRGSEIRVVDVQPADIRTSFNEALGAPQTNDADLLRVWRQIDANLQAAPPPEFVARRIGRLLMEANPPPRLTVGGMFQAGVAPLIFRFLPQRVRIWGLKRYYRL